MQNIQKLTIDKFKTEAKKLREKDPSIKTHSQALDLLSNKYGYASWKILKPIIIKQEEDKSNQEHPTEDRRLILSFQSFDEKMPEQLFILEGGRYILDGCFGIFPTDEGLDFLDLVHMLIYTDESQSVFNIKNVLYVADDIAEIIEREKKNFSSTKSEDTETFAILEMLLEHKDKTFVDNEVPNNHEPLQDSPLDKIFYLKEVLLDGEQFELSRLGSISTNDYKETKEYIALTIDEITSGEDKVFHKIAYYLFSEDFSDWNIDAFIEEAKKQVEHEIARLPELIIATDEEAKPIVEELGYAEKEDLMHSIAYFIGDGIKKELLECLHTKMPTTLISTTF